MQELQEQIVTQPQELPECCAYLAACPAIGFDTEFVGEDTYHPHLCLLQVATPERLILIDPLTVGPLDAFWRLVTDPERLVVVHAGREEVRLCRLSAGQAPGNLFDLQIAAGMVGMTYPLGHGNLVHQVLGVQLRKGETLTEWRDRPLTRAQVRYALDDVRYVLPVWQKLARRIKELGREDWVREEFARMTSQGLPEQANGTVERWRKLRGLGSFDRRRLAAARELFRWREETAARTNRPARAICRDDLIIEIVRRNPTREHDLLVVRGLPKRDLKSIVDVIERARQLPIDQCPTANEREQDPPQVAMVASVLSAALSDWCSRNSLTPNLVASGQDLKLLVRSRLQRSDLPEDSLLCQGWRRAHVLPELLAVLDGKRSMRVANVSAESPFSFENC